MTGIPIAAGAYGGINGVKRGSIAYGWSGTEVHEPLVNPEQPGYLYVMGSLRNDQVPVIADKVRERTSFRVFDDWCAAAPDADDKWKLYEEARGRDYIEALGGHAAEHIFALDLKHLNLATHGLLVLPAGRSAHMELGYLVGRGRRVVILLDGDYDRWDVMYNFADAVVTSVSAAIRELQG